MGRAMVMGCKPTRMGAALLASTTMNSNMASAIFSSGMGVPMLENFSSARCTASGSIVSPMGNATRVHDVRGTKKVWSVLFGIWRAQARSLAR
ncbi:hypothetical protein KSP40_PGU000455 [Platanthera guangdongensis]|uniref:Secreted protein n=1 Tax=Platanthera guangdongensis TaxID=2320717 RepID=A0ABR2MH39_9ASPA